MTATERPSDIKDCPWCRSMLLRQVGRCIECLSCGASGPEMKQEDTRQDYIRRWNDRTLDAAPADPVVSDGVADCLLRRAIAWLSKPPRILRDTYRGSSRTSLYDEAIELSKDLERARELAREGM